MESLRTGNVLATRKLVHQATSAPLVKTLFLDVNQTTAVAAGSVTAGMQVTWNPASALVSSMYGLAFDSQNKTVTIPSGQYRFRVLVHGGAALTYKLRFGTVEHSVVGTQSTPIDFMVNIDAAVSVSVVVLAVDAISGNAGSSRLTIERIGA